MKNRFVKYGVTLVIVLFVVFFGFKIISPSEVYTDTDEAVKSQLIVNGFKIDSITFYGNQVLAMLEEKGEEKLYIGDREQSTIENVKPWADFQLPINPDKKYQGVEVNPDSHLMYLYGKKEDGSNFMEIINIATKETVSEIPFEGSAEISNIKFKNGYLEGMLYAKTNPEKQNAEIIFNTTEFNSHMDLLAVELPSKKATLDWVDANPELEHIVYTIKDKGKVSAYVHDLTTNQTTQLTKINGDKFLYDGEQLVGFKSKKDKLAINVYENNHSESAEDKSSDAYDIVIKNGIVLDPDKETLKIGYHVGIKDDKVAAVTKATIQGTTEIDAYQKIVSPGFIDMLSFNPSPNGAKFKIGDGVTTNLSMHGCTADFNGFFDQYDKYPTSVNYGGALYAVRLRYEAGLGNHGTPTQEQIDYMVKRAREEIKKGALAVAFSPEYYPGTTPEEIKAIMKVAKEYGLVTHFHGRHSSLTGEHTSIDSVKEVLGYARELDAPVHFMHLHSTGGTGAMDEALALIEEARSEGYQVTYDVYPYDSWATNISFERMSGDWQSRFGITYSDIQVAGTTERLTAETFPKYRKKGGIVIVDAMDEKELIQALQVDHSMIGSDATMDNEFNHPRGAGTFSRFIGRYIRDLDVLPLMEGMKKITIHSARQLEDIAPAMSTRGRLHEGATADITVFDYHEIIDTATAEKPASLSKGVDYVIVSGKIAKDDTGVLTQVKNGQPIIGVFE
ncbi:amidohydrolase family protein [Bacillus sp. JJ1562]|uniref:amidohydrolase family protein n=1 Tax=Bacillus sp. JJ1562 TaxID=3122960 RepID=UPI003001F0F9